jgi:hypothetical protein
MTTTSVSRSALLCAAIIPFITDGDTFAQTRNCPTVSNQVVRMDSGRSAIFRLAATNAETSTVSVFQYPLGGILEQVGPTALDYAFVPGPEFKGTTEFTYRLSPPFGCGDGSLLGKVSFIGAPATSTASGLDVDPETGISPIKTDELDPLALLGLLSLANGSSGLCGLGGLPFFLFTGAALVTVQTSRRRAR